MEVDDDAKCRRKLDEQRKKMQRELREVERLSFASKEVQENLVESLQHLLQEVEKKRNDLMPERQRVQKRSQKIQSIQDKRKKYAERKLGGKRGNAENERRNCVEGRALQSRQKQWQMRKQKQSFRDCKLEKKEEAAMLRRQETAAWRAYGRKLLPCVQQWVQTRSMSSKGSRKVEQFRSRCQEENKSKAEPVSKWRGQRQAGSIKLHQRAVWSLTILVYGVFLVKAEVQEDHAREVHPDR